MGGMAKSAYFPSPREALRKGPMGAAPGNARDLGLVPSTTGFFWATNGSSGSYNRQPLSIILLMALHI
jgi:hypothetical protein